MWKIQILLRDKLREIGLWRDASQPAWELWSVGAGAWLEAGYLAVLSGESGRIGGFLWQ